MKHLLMILAAIALSLNVAAQTRLSTTEAASPGEEQFMDMAVGVARTSVAQGHKPCGAVVVLNGSCRGAGMPVGGQSAEQDALARSRRTSIPGGTVYTVNQPVAAALEAMARAGITLVYYVNPMEDVTAAGIYTAADYEGAPDDAPRQIRMDYAPASELIGKAAR